MNDLKLKESGVDSKMVTIPASDGVDIIATIFTRQGNDTRGVVIIASGVGLLQERYSEYAAYLAGNGWTVMTFDYRGIGQSVLKRDLQSGSCLRDWGRYDLAACIDWAESQPGGRRIVVVAHSVGGQIFSFAPNHHKVDSMIAICAQKGYWKFWDGRRRIGLLSLWYVLPVMVSIFGYLPLGLMGKGADIPAGVAREWGRWGRNKAFVDERGESLNAKFAKVSCRILAISFSDDKFYAPRRAVEALNAVYLNSALSHWHITPKELGCEWLGHFGFFRDKEQIRSLWSRADSWLDRTDEVKAIQSDAGSREVVSTQAQT